jgi:hypothetical protein
MKNRISIPIALVCAAFALGVAGCGGDDETSSTTTTSSTSVGATGATGGEPLTKDEFIAQADAVCAAGDQTINAAGQSLGQNPTEEQLTEVITGTVVPTISGEFDAIDALTPPEGDEDAIAELLASGRAAIEEITDNPERLYAAGQDNPFAEVNQLAQDYGFKDCGSDNSSAG